ncbi:MAG TPA: zinc dependent phospholipase C family protein [Gemmatimonadales bacterium]|nr:zinc dependent phospholipase C family protein [Gemmatimonadales bacterium]
MTARRVVTVLLLAAVALVVGAEPLWAWTPGTHVYLGESLLANLHLLPAAVAELLRAFPYDFLYGNIAADSSIAKKYAPVGRHCHYWHVGQEIHDHAPTDALRAFGLGYLCHLAADVVAHNFFVPRQLMLTSSTAAVGHSYWESRIDHHLGARYPRAAKELILMDTAQADAHLATVISPTIFSIATNRRLFRGMVHLTEHYAWQRGLKVAVERSRFTLADEDVERHLGLAYDYMVDLLAAEEPTARKFDPSGERALHVSKVLRRQVLLEGTRQRAKRLVEAAEDHYGLPREPLIHWPGRIRPLPWKAPALARGRRRIEA